VKIEITQLGGELVSRFFKRLNDIGNDFTPLMTDIAGTLDDEKEQNFAEQGRPPWTPLAKSTLKRRPDRADGIILQDSGWLKSTITTNVGKTFAEIGSNAAYARICSPYD